MPNPNPKSLYFLFSFLCAERLRAPFVTMVTHPLERLGQTEGYIYFGNPKTLMENQLRCAYDGIRAQ